MALEYVWKGLLVIAALSIVGVVLVQAGVVSAPWGPDSGEVRISDGGSDGSATETDEPKAVVDVEIADDNNERYTGLSDHDSLEPGDGMLFVYDEEQDLTFVMREMDFDIDIIYIGADGEITSIHHARAPRPGEDGETLQYPGRGKWVLEVPRGYSNETGIEVGDQVEIDLQSNRTTITSVSPGGFDRVVTPEGPDAGPREAIAAGPRSIRR
ncbi:DUF192 domain-containing protein [Natrinema salsiterrestre]|uniref:DUF192 domain-containing protein n=1 Tax=Natrinema salsiterrestre TaxID=2950540 RepID=A0A9Q4Q1R4_9EURY|nr:DUF192 domain-containing protein [Natrinema salsiterrestre]MDF9745801.1 DUF192 domain-containing protein [Natrinema salsiterrestre]